MIIRIVAVVKYSFVACAAVFTTTDLPVFESAANKPNRTVNEIIKCILDNIDVAYNFYRVEVGCCFCFTYYLNNSICYCEIWILNCIEMLLLMIY